MRNKRDIQIGYFLILLIQLTDHRLIDNLKSFIDSALAKNLSDENATDLLINQLSRILEEEEGLQIVNQTIKYLNNRVDGSGDDIEDEEYPSFIANMSIFTDPFGTTTTTEFTKYTPQEYASCRCEKGERGEKGDPGFCPVDCGQGHHTYTRDCLGPRINLERLAQSIRQLIMETKKIAYRNARSMPCMCPMTVPVPVPVPYPFFPDYNMYFRLKGEKGDAGISCPSKCFPSQQTNVRVFPSLQDALLASCDYPDHTYVHIVNEQGRLQGVFIRVQNRLIPIKLENEETLPVRNENLPTAISIPKPKCTLTLPCPRLHLFALGPHIRTMCNPYRPNIFCSKLSDYDALCARVSQRFHLQGFYRAFLSTSTQWLVNLFDGICLNAKIMNMNEQVLYESFDDIFEQKAPLNEILDVRGLKPQFQYWWHGTFSNGTASIDTCLDWSRQDSNYSGLASRLTTHFNGLFANHYKWPCSIMDSNIGILCIETNCDKRNFYKR